MNKENRPEYFNQNKQFDPTKKYIIPLSRMVTSQGRQQYVAYDNSADTLFVSQWNFKLKQIFTRDELYSLIPPVYRNMAIQFKKGMKL